MVGVIYFKTTIMQYVIQWVDEYSIKVIVCIYVRNNFYRKFLNFGLTALIFITHKKHMP